MNLNKPILVGWQKTPQAEFIRRHRRLFAPSSKGSAILTPGLVLFLLPFFLAGALISQNTPEWVLFAFIIALFAVTGIYIVLVQAAFEAEDKSD
jgi:hypothetical protein